VTAHGAHRDSNVPYACKTMRHNIELQRTRPALRDGASPLNSVFADFGGIGYPERGLRMSPKRRARAPIVIVDTTLDPRTSDRAAWGP
jgi:hypothetical protein